MAKPIISVNICAYNGEDLLPNALGCMLRQETGGAFSIEIVVIDDASTDTTAACVRALADTATVPLRYVLAEGKGVAHARNVGAAQSRGEWIAWFDQDQVTESGWLQELYRTACETDADLVIEMYKIMKEGGYEFDGVWLGCDLGYRNGLLFSPQHYNEQLRPTFRRLFDFFHGEGLPVILHSCGNVKELIPYFIADGLNCLQPLEVKAGMDLLELKREFGDKLAFMGGIDVRSMADPDPKVIEKEISAKISEAKKGGGYIYHSDHSVPNDVSLEQYRRVIELAQKYGMYDIYGQ